MTAVAAVLVILVGWRALSGIDPYFDTFAYHLPFAARLSGVCPESCYRMHAFLEARFVGFPKLYTLFQGLAWRVSGTPVAAHALTLVALAGFAVYLRRSFSVPVGWSLVGLLAVPLIQIHASASYIDLPLNLLVAIAVLAIMDLTRAPTSGWRRPLLVVACLGIVANSKLTMIPLAGALWLWLFAILALRRQRDDEAGGQLWRWSSLVGLALVSSVVIFASAWHNLIVFANPVYPLQVQIAGLHLPGPEVALEPKWDSLAAVWHDVPSPLRWLASLLELSGYAGRPLPWTHDQGTCLSAPLLEPCLLSEAPSFRMGGYFVAYVLFLLAYLASRVRWQTAPVRRIVLATFAGVTVLAAFFPHSHELRYVKFWIITLVALTLICSFSPAFAPPQGEAPRRVLAIGTLAALASVVLLTGGHYLVAAGWSVDELIRDLGIDRRVHSVEDGEIVCVDPKWQPFTFLFSSAFHPGRRYTILDGPIGPCTSTIGPPPRPTPISG